ncbi:MAG TPA: outer membrane lipoprotein-sorting protein [Saprospiraceae bacterium]|nr:outer membrane lipoprotein-sorting protein [Saprospiraceae bacterium]
MKPFTWLLILTLLGTSLPLRAQLDATAIVQKAEDKLRGATSKSTLKMTIVRPNWTREVEMKSWSKGNDYSLTLVTAPARDKGTAFLKRQKEIWNWQPTIDRVIKMPPSMMMQSWMGSDLKNDDLVRESSIVEDYEHQLLGEEAVNGLACYKIEMIPREDAPVVWGKVITWIDKSDYMQLKTEFYDEDDYLVNTIYGKEIKTMDGKKIPSVMEVVPADEEGHKTILAYQSLEFDEPIPTSFFSIQNMKRVR